MIAIENFGRLHPLIVHLPIGILLFGYILLLWQRVRNVDLELASSIAFLIGGISAVLACAFGWILGQSGEYDADLLLRHQWTGVATAVLGLAAYWIRKYRWALANLTVLILTLAGHFGGVLTHGEGYLWPNETEAIQETDTENTGILYQDSLNANEPLLSEQKEVTRVFVYRDQVVPILKKKCYSCHSATKLKGGLRLDTEAYIRKGGKKGTILVAGNPQESRLFSYLVLPLEHDDHMPPKGKPQLSRNEIGLLHQWIAKGASFREEVLSAPSEGSLLASSGSFLPFSEGTWTASEGLKDEQEPKTLSIPNKEDAILNQKMAPIPPDLLTALADKKITVEPLTQAHVSVNFVNVSTYRPDLLDALKPLGNRLVRLRLAGQPVRDQDIENLKYFPNLTRLNLEQTTIGDSGLKHLIALPQLQYLNLYGTQVTDEGIAQLADCKELKVLYLWKTKVSEEGIATLQKALPNLQIDRGSVTLMKPDSNRVP
jgi:uncharacterized membrane protein